MNKEISFDDEFRYKFYWKDSSGKVNQIFTDSSNDIDAVNGIIEYIRTRIYSDSFVITGYDKWIDNSWIKQDFISRWCEGR